jgi:hypothetical protein
MSAGADALALALAAVATAVVAVRDGGRHVLPGGLVLVVSSGCFVIAGVHIYWPRRVLTNAGDGHRLRLAGLNSAPSGLVRQRAAAGDPIRASQNDGTGGSLHRLAAFDSHGRFDDPR